MEAGGRGQSRGAPRRQGRGRGRASEGDREGWPAVGGAGRDPGSQRADAAVRQLTDVPWVPRKWRGPVARQVWGPQVGQRESEQGLVRTARCVPASGRLSWPSPRPLEEARFKCPFYRWEKRGSDRWPVPGWGDVTELVHDQDCLLPGHPQVGPRRRPRLCRPWLGALLCHTLCFGDEEPAGFPGSLVAAGPVSWASRVPAIGGAWGTRFLGGHLVASPPVCSGPARPS